jgi:hypothetical protein
MSAPVQEPGYPQWLQAVKGEEEPSIGLYVARGLDAATALRRILGQDEPVRVQLPPVWAEGISPVEAALGSENAVLAGQVGEWAWVFDYNAGTYLSGFAVRNLSIAGGQAAVCTDNIEGDTVLTYAEDGENRFEVTEPVTVYTLEELPEPLRAAAAESGVYATSAGAGEGWDPSENFRVVCALAGLLELTIDGLRPMELIGVALPAHSFGTRLVPDLGVDSERQAPHAARVAAAAGLMMSRFTNGRPGHP